MIILCSYDDLIFLNCYSLFYNLRDFSLQLNLSDTEILLLKNVLTYRNVLHPNLETSGTGYWDRLWAEVIKIIAWNQGIGNKKNWEIFRTTLYLVVTPRGGIINILFTINCIITILNMDWFRLAAVEISGAWVSEE